MSSRMAKAGGDVGKLIRKRLVVVRPGGAAPDLEAVARARDDDVLPQLAVLEQEGRKAHPPGRVELGVQRVGGEEPVQLARGLRERVHPRERRLHIRVVGLRRPDLHAPLDPLREDDALAQRSPELGRDRQPVLGVEGVVEGAAEGHLSSRAPRGEEWTRTGVEGGEEPPPPGPHAALVPHYPPLRNPPCTFSPTDVVGLTPEGPNPPLRRAIAGWETVRPRALPSRNARCVRAGCTRDCRPAAVPSAACACRVGRRGPARGYDGPTMPPRSRRVLLALIAGLLLTAGAIAGCASSS